MIFIFSGLIKNEEMKLILVYFLIQYTQKIVFLISNLYKQTKKIF